MGPTWKKEYLDFVLVPGGLLVMLGYHLFHLHRCINRAETTVVGYENYNRRVWVSRVLEVEVKDRDQALTVMGNYLSAAMSLASIALALSSFIGAWIGSTYHGEVLGARVYGNTSSTMVYIKYVAILSSFMIAFACFVHAATSFLHAGFLISLPNCVMPPGNVESAVITGSNFWVVGLRSLYLATNLLLWIFGPIPMFVSSVITVVLLQYLDRNSIPFPQYDRPQSYDSFKKIDDREESGDSLNGTSSLLPTPLRT
ncbi:uncharacterized protein LOC131012840 isoform X2 [Salvia miltiorrhiza]|uniref:uncharacterized protein LOC131012840 isoform X2 n=1 Tax=Salvia miltiorrhiza TaxID=226208 RepID=UPI0025ABCFE0|nr:uncharacterized protein LOC131012840 isoform X2 [Salvia miltiorrhiza]